MFLSLDLEGDDFRWCGVRSFGLREEKLEIVSFPPLPIIISDHLCKLWMI